MAENQALEQDVTPEEQKPMPPPPEADIDPDRVELAEERWEHCPLRDCKRNPELLYADFYLRDIRTNRLMCSACAIRVEMGYMAREVVKESDDRFFECTNADYGIVFGVHLAGSIVVNTMMVFFGFWFIALFLGGAAGAFIAQIARRMTEGRVGRQSPYVAVGGIVVGALLAPTAALLLRAGIFVFAPQFALTNVAILIATVTMSASAYGVFMRRI